MKKILAILAIGLCGCISQSQRDVYPDELAGLVEASKADAIAFYTRKWGEPPKSIPHFRITLSDQTIPVRGVNAAGIINGRSIVVWRGEITKRVISHEIRHLLNFANGHGGQGTEQAERDVQ